MTIEELTKNEIQRLENEDKISEYEKEIAKYKKTISNLKEKDKLFNKALKLCENKINLIKQNSLEKLISLCDEIKSIKSLYHDECQKIDDDLTNHLFLFEEKYDYILDTIYDVVKKIDEESYFSSSGKKPESNKFEMKDLGNIDNFDQFAEMKKELRKNIAKKYNKDNSKSSKKEKTIKAKTDEQDEQEESDLPFDNSVITEKFNKMFYDKPKESNIVSNIDSTDDFDFNEALNPTLSLSDIMNDIMALKGDETDENDNLFSVNDNSNDNSELDIEDEETLIDSDLLENEDYDNDIEELEDDDDFEESSYEKKSDVRPVDNSKITRRETDENLYSGETKNTRDDYEKKFTYLQNIFKGLK